MIEVTLLEPLMCEVEIEEECPVTVEIEGEIVKVGDYERYSGPYEVKPTFSEQKLSTKDSVMDKDVTVSPISITKISNTSGGNTVIIGG